MKAYSSIKIWIFLIFVIFMVNGCSKDNDEITYDLTGNWKVVYYLDIGKKITKTEENSWLDINNGNITANFTEPDIEGKGNVSGTRVTNGYNGNYTIKENGEISFEQILQTEINEPEWTDLFNLEAVKHYQIKNAILLLYYNNNNNIIALERD
ncbi:hypothetical protein MHL31_03030 [Lutibacter sp. A80]|uniref:hypothetical protein n=1 Tax=Lutibacter sp. A80 TaxID=2918453 RepID=UPI001F0678EA|nr:hypothetical protein [Lutibacter sp. A80]UMB61186.1 hypothetical protein MHL31_03030 [Lutibacter sp. A80]